MLAFPSQLSFIKHLLQSCAPASPSSIKCHHCSNLFNMKDVDFSEPNRQFLNISLLLLSPCLVFFCHFSFNLDMV